jgi:predicted nucleic acid-binding protein
LESPESVCIVDDALARRVAGALGLRCTVTLGVLLETKRAGITTSVRPLLDQLQSLGFRLAGHTRVAVLKLAG